MEERVGGSGSLARMSAHDNGGRGLQRFPRCVHKMCANGAERFGVSPDLGTVRMGVRLVN